MGRVASGWQASGTTILQDGYPFVVSTNAAFAPFVGAGGTYTGYASDSGDYNADGDNFDFPDVTSYKYSTGRHDYLHGLFPASNFPQPSTFGSEGNEQYSRFRGPGFEKWDVAMLKNTAITEGTSLQLRLEFYKLFDRPNLTNMDTNLPDGNFGKATDSGGFCRMRFAQ